MGLREYKIAIVFLICYVKNSEEQIGGFVGSILDQGKRSMGRGGNNNPVIFSDPTLRRYGHGTPATATAPSTSSSPPST